MSLYNLLAAITGQDTGAVPQTVDPDGNPIDPNATAEVEPLVVTAAKRPEEPPRPSVEQGPQRVGLNYDNSASVAALDQAMSKLPTPRGGSANPGLYGLLPERMQHGTLRNVLGAIGDAFLVQSGNKPTYGPRMERQQMGQAMAGYDPNDEDASQAAIQRVAATGASDAPDMVEKLQTQNSNAAIRREQMAQTAAYREGLAQDRDAAAVARYIPVVGGMVSRADTPEKYAAAYERASRLAERINPEMTAADFGLPDPEDWTPEVARNLGLTANNIVTSEDKAAGRRTSERNTDVRASTSVKVAGIGAGARIQAANISGDKATEATMLQGILDKQNRNEPLSSAEQQFWDSKTKGKSGRRLPPGLTTGGGRPAPAAPKAPAKPTFQEGKVYQDAKGVRMRYVNGKWVKP